MNPNELFLNTVNLIRYDHDKPALKWDDGLSMKAQQNAETVARDKRNRLWHPTTGVNEIAARGQETIQEVCESWLDSPGHRKIILGTFSKVGIGTATGRNGDTVWMAQFI